MPQRVYRFRDLRNAGVSYTRKHITHLEKAGAFPLLNEVAGALDAPPADGAPGAPVRPQGFWQAWTLMLELLKEEDKDGSRGGAIAAHIKRLEATDPGLGGEPWKSRIEAVRTKVAR